MSSGCAARWRTLTLDGVMQAPGPDFGMLGHVCAAFAVLLSLAVAGCGESDGPTSPTGPSGLDHRNRAARVHGLERPGGPICRPTAQACVIGVGTTHTHPSWRAFAAIPLQAGAARPVQTHVHRPARRYPCVSPGERSELLRRESDRCGHAERVREQCQPDPEHDDARQRGRARLCVHGGAERDGQSVGPAWQSPRLETRIGWAGHRSPYQSELYVWEVMKFWAEPRRRRVSRRRRPWSSVRKRLTPGSAG